MAGAARPADEEECSAGERIALAIICKAPVAGACKTRLCPPLTAGEAAELSRCFIGDMTASIAAAAQRGLAQGIAIFTPEDDAAAFDGLLPSGFAMRAQRGCDLTSRLLCAIEDLLADGYTGVCLIDSDSPTLPVPILTRAIDLLRQPGDRLVLGPAIDGGYYLAGVKQPHASLFQDIAWSTAGVLAQTLVRAAALRLPLDLLPTWYDVDDLDSLQMLLHELFGAGAPLPAPGLTGAPAARSRQFLQRLLITPTAARFGFTP